jgi:imidazolonepropionase-like amidohydrolase
VISGPRVCRSISPICRTGGHAWCLGRQTDGPEQLAARVREHRWDGADFIKLMASGGTGTVGSDAGMAEYTRPELAAVIDEAHRLSLRVAAHAHGGSGADDAIVASVACPRTPGKR